MPLRVSKPIEKTVALKRADPSGETKVTVRQATFEQYMLREELFAESRLVYNDALGEVTRYTKLSDAEVHALEIFLTFVSSNIEDAEGDPLLLPADEMSESVFKSNLGKLDRDVVDEIHEAVLDINPDWDFGNARTKGKKSGKK